MITDNAILAFECFHSIQKNRKPENAACAYKLDISKAYDRVDWGFFGGISWVSLIAGLDG
jgi:hypothetical protein